MPQEDGVNNKPLGSDGVEQEAQRYDAVGYAIDNPRAGLNGVYNDRREHNPVRRSKPYGR